MANSLSDKLGQEVDAIAAAYESGFAGQSRATRDVAELERLMGRVSAVLRQVDEIPAPARGAELARVREVAETNLRIYQTEREAIRHARAAGPEYEAFALLASSANFVFARYQRHFAGKGRETRDLGLLSEMVEDLKQVRQRMAAAAAKSNFEPFRKDVELVGQNLEMYQNEIREIGNAQNPADPEAKASILANIANSQFNVYRHHFAGAARVTRRPGLLQRVIDNLRRTRDNMLALRKAGFTAEYNDKNIEIVEANLRTYETELGEIRKMRQSTPIPDIMGLLGSHANELFEAYRQGYAGKDRVSVDMDALGVLSDRLGEVARQMVDLGRAEHNEMNEGNVQIVFDHLSMFDREYEAIAQAKAQAAEAQAPGAAPST